MIKKGKSDSAPIAKRKLKHTGEQKEEQQKQDFFMEALTSAVNFIERNRKQVLMTIIGFIIAGLGAAGVYVYTQSSSQVYGDLYYDASFETAKRVQEAKDKKLLGKLDQEDITKLVKKYEGIVGSESKEGEALKNLASEQEVYLALYDLGVIYYNIQDYEKAIRRFDEAYEKKDDFHLAFLALYNRANCFFNIGYKAQQKKDYETAIGKYNFAIDSYQQVESEFVDSPVLPLTYRYRGLTNEYLAECYLQMKKPDKAKEALAKSEKHYKKLIEFYKAKMPASSIEEVESALRRLDIKKSIVGK